MKLVVTGGGTGGHVFPALEVARTSVAQGNDVVYFGSLRGQERAACSRESLAFIGFPSEPIYSLKSASGIKAILKLARATLMARKALRKASPNVVFSTGGYASAPVVRAALILGIPYVLHEQNSVPGRSNLIGAKRAYAVATTFHSAAKHFHDVRTERTGLPVRKELRDAAKLSRLVEAEPFNILAVGGSQGAASLNEAVLSCATRITANVNWVHVTGKKHFETLFPTYEKLGISNIYRMKSFLESQEMAEAYSEASIVVGRSGAGTLSELAAFGLPSVLVPFPSAHANHQFHNAEEFEGLGAATIIQQNQLHPSDLEEAIMSWLEIPSARDSAGEALARWDVPDAADKILGLLREAATSVKK